MTFHPTLFQVRYAENPINLPTDNKEYGTLLYHFQEKRAKSFPNCPERNKYFTYQLPPSSADRVDFDEVSYFVILNIPPMKRTDTVKITMFGDSNTNKGKLDLVGRIKNPSLPLGGYPLPPPLGTEFSQKLTEKS